MNTRQAMSRAIRPRSVARILPVILALLGGLRPAPAQAQSATNLIGGTISIFAGSKDQNASQAYDGVQANKSQIVQPYFMTLDADGNLYFSYGGGVSVVYGGNKVPPILAHRVPSPQSGYQYMIAGSLAGPGSAPLCAPPDPCGDGGPALVPAGTTNPLNTPFGIAVDADGNLYIADEVEQSIRKVSAADGTISTIVGDPMHARNGYSGDGGPATSALLNYPNTVKFDSAGNLYIADSGNYLIRRIDTSGKITTIAGNMAAAQAANGSGSFPSDCSVSADNCGEGGPPLSATLGFVFGMSFDPNGNLFLAETNIHVIREIDLSASSPKIHTVAGTLRTACSPAAPPTPPQCGDGGAATSAQLNNPYDVLADVSGNVIISDQFDNGVRLVTASDGRIQTIAGQLSATGGYGGDNGPATAATLDFPWGLAWDNAGNLYIADSINSLIRQVTPVTARTPQTIDFSQIPNAAYGTSPIPLNATALDSTTHDPTNLPVTFKVSSGPGKISGNSLVVLGAGSITVEADQAGNSTYGPASATQTVTIAPAILTVTGPANLTLIEGQPVPQNITAAISGFVAGDTQSAVLTGGPTVVVVDPKGTAIPAGTILPVGTYTVKVTQGSLTLTPGYAQDYQLSFVNGSLLVSAGKLQTITISPFMPPTTYGDPHSSFSFTATASSGLPVDVTFSPEGLVHHQQTTAGWYATVVGAGKITITATQGGDSTYAPATATQTFIVNPATLTITPVNATRPYNTPNPAFTYVATGFVGSDTAALLSGAPNYTTTAVQSSQVGTYSINATQGTLFAQNYTFAFNPGTLTVTPASQTISFGDVKDLPYGTAPEIVFANASSGLPVQYTASGPAKLQPAPDGSSVAIFPTDIGPVTVTATQAGNKDYEAAAPASVSFNIVRAPLNVFVSSFSRPVGAPNPTFTYSLQDPGPDPIAPPYVTGTPDLSTVATESSPPGQYPIVAVQGTLAAEHYYFVFNSGTLTVTSASSYIITTTPTSLTIPRGSTRQLTVTVTPVNNYSGSVSLGCSGLPAGVSCSFSPASLMIPPPNPGQATADPVQGTLTIVANGNTASVESRSFFRQGGGALPAGFLLVPAGLGGLLLLIGRRRFLRSIRSQSGLAVVILLCILGALAACGGGSSNANQATPGTAVIQVTGAGTPSDGASNLNQSVSLSLTIQ